MLGTIDFNEFLQMMTAKMVSVCQLSISCASATLVPLICVCPASDDCVCVYKYLCVLL